MSLTPAWVGVGIGAAGFVTAIVMAIAKSSAQSSADDVANLIVAHGGTQGTCVNPTPTFANACSTLADNNNKVDTDATIANIGIGVGIAGGAFALIWFLVARKSNGGPEPTRRPPRRRRHRRFITPLVGPRMTGLSVAF